MSRNRLAVLAIGAGTSLLAILLLTPQFTSVRAQGKGKGVIMQKAISEDLAMEMAQAALAKCRASNFHVSVHVIDNLGFDIVAIRDDGSSLVNFDVSRRKAITALTYKRPSSEMEKQFANMSPARVIPDIFAVQGGVPVKVGDETIGAVGVGGATGPGSDQACATAGVQAVADQLK
jgi:uncharacterized protein GlcG (DUF336 family)